MMVHMNIDRGVREPLQKSCGAFSASSYVPSCVDVISGGPLLLRNAPAAAAKNPISVFLVLVQLRCIMRLFCWSSVISIS